MRVGIHFICILEVLGNAEEKLIGERQKGHIKGILQNTLEEI